MMKEFMNRTLEPSEQHSIRSLFSHSQKDFVEAQSHESKHVTLQRRLKTRTFMEDDIARNQFILKYIQKQPPESVAAGAGYDGGGNFMSPE